jgi:ferric-dicitrate binding protein FerR (iron transport regulator)
MESREHHELPEDLEHTADWLRAQRPEVGALDLDRIKQRARAQALRGEPAGRRLERPRRTLSTALAVLALTVGLGGAFAIGKQAPPSAPFSGDSNTSAASTQYKPGKGCGDQTKPHNKENQCKPPKPK